jgi:hypothetical protein
MEASQKGVYMPGTYVRGAWSLSEDLQERVLTRLGGRKRQRGVICLWRGAGVRLRFWQGIFHRRNPASPATE